MWAGGRSQQTGVDEDVDSSFFVSYSHEDAHYVTRLVDHLRGFGLPLWFDGHLAWGSQFTREIRQRLSRALGIIVVMSPGADQSEWVEREILEGQRHDRLFLPILLSGERLFLLASSNYFDARDGSFPGEREIQELQRIRDAKPGFVPRQSPLDIPAGKPAPRTTRVPAQISLRKLSTFLADGQLEHADILTTSLLLESVNRIDHGWMRRTDGKTISAGLLHDVDDLWSRFSGGQHGFRAQLALHRVPPPGAPEGRQRDFSALALSLGWKRAQRDTMPRYGDFIARPEFPAGFFPTLRNPQLEQNQSWHDHWMETVMAVQLQLRATKGWK
ncbi:toll/interleukin-1 receptor domain-containing protein [Saccharopolyspora shandongensis]|uniref:toll/interleukin-1 receptor domain-containing protein n=1 Tax=Saccharopolyspora shandongensis TaxID=418495 RepID=UPI0033F73A3F